VDEESLCGAGCEFPEVFEIGKAESPHQVLYPGESFTTDDLIDDSIYVVTFKAGEKYTYGYDGEVLGWWDWGTKEVR
jgi:hypothetical protein